MPDEPSRWISRLLGRLLPESERDAILGDLAEEYRARRAEGLGRPAARRWYRRQAVAAIRMTLSPTSGHDLPPSRVFALGDLLHELRYALRQLGRRPLHTGVVVLTLALGIGATSAVLSVANPILFRPLPYPDPDRLVVVNEIGQEGQPSQVGYETFLDIRQGTRSFATAAVSAYWSPVLMGAGDPEQLRGQSVSADFFRTLGTPLLLGRDFLPEEDVRDRNRVVILGWNLWQRQFGGDPALLNRTISLGGTAYTVVGILPRGVSNLLSPQSEIWRPLGYAAALPWACRTCRHLGAIARVRPGASLEQAQAELDQVAARLVADHPTSYALTGVRATRLHHRLVREVRPAVVLMLGAGGFVLLISCANVGNLALARTAERSGELVLRAALGAGRGRLLWQLVLENLVLCAIGALAGLVLAGWGVTALVGLAPAGLPRLDAVRLDWRVVLITLGTSLLVALGIGVGPGLLALTRYDESRPASGRTMTETRRHRRLTGALVVSEVALAFMLVMGAGLLVRSLSRVLAVDPGFDPDRLLTLQVVAAGPRYQENEPVWQLQDRLVEALRALPGVTHAALTSQVPLGGNLDAYGVRAEDRVLDNPEEAPASDRYAVTAGYLGTMRIPVLRGRGLLPGDRTGSLPVVVVNETLARQWWPGEDPVGRRVQMGAADTPWRTVVGVVGDVRHAGLDADRTPQFYVPMAQWTWADNQFNLVVRTATDPGSLVRAVTEAIRRVDHTLAVSDVATGDQLVAAVTADRRLIMRLFEAFALVALLLAGAGIYGVLSRRVAERRRELGIRAALGATRQRLLHLVLGDGGRLTLLGVAAGLVGALGLSRMLDALLFNLAPHDPATLGTTTAVLVAAAVLACLVPAWRATRVDPGDALRV